jgi:hypothetical protein
VKAIADEDMERSNDEKTSAVHFLRFELPDETRAALRDGADLAFGIDHPQYSAEVTVSAAIRSSLVGDLA